MRNLIQSIIGKGDLLLTRKIVSCKQCIQGELNASQRRIIFPQNNGLVRYDLLDITLMYKIVRNIFHEEIEPNSVSSGRWGKTTYANDTSLLAAIETIRLRRNDFYAHATSAAMKDSDFHKIWDDLEKSVTKISENIDSSVSSVCYQEEMKNLKTSSLNPEIEQLSRKLLELEYKCYRVDGKEKGKYHLCTIVSLLTMLCATFLISFDECFSLLFAALALYKCLCTLNKVQTCLREFRTGQNSFPE